MPASDPAKVALLASAGAARERLREALDGAGGELVLVAAPGELQPGGLAASGAQAVIIALEPAFEADLARLEDDLADPALTVVYDEAELALMREGWDAQRWMRHLLAKLHGHGEVLPPGAEEEAPQLSRPGLQTAPRPHAPSEPSLFAHLSEASEQADTLPRDPLADTAGGSSVGTSFADWTLSDASPAEQGQEPATAAADAGTQPADAFAIEPEHWQPPQGGHHLELVDDFRPLQETPAPAAELPPPLPPELPEPPLPAAPPVASPAPFVPKMELTLEEITPAGEPRPGAAPFAPEAAGVLVLLAGIGGPDAVRRVLANLPSHFDRPVLMLLRLDGGRYDNLVKQMQRASSLPTVLAHADTRARGGYVYVVPDEVAADVGPDGGIAFHAGTTDAAVLFGVLPPADSAVLLLSGADAALVEPALMLAARGALVAAQDPAACYDATTPRALADAGIETDTPEQLAARVASHLTA